MEQPLPPVTYQEEVLRVAALDSWRINQTLMTTPTMFYQTRGLNLLTTCQFLKNLNLILMGLSSYNFKHHVASDIGVDQKFLPSENFKSQEYLNGIVQWTDNNLMKLNSKKSNSMIFNFTKNFQFSTRLYIKDQLLDIIPECKLLGTIISADLTWRSNTEFIVKKSYKRMIMLHKLYPFNIGDAEMVNIYILFIRSVLEQSCQVWSYSITEEE